MFELTILSIFRQSAGYLSRYFFQVEKAFELSNGKCHAVWLEGDSEDDTYELLSQEKIKLESLGHTVTLVKFDLKGPHWASTANNANRWTQLATCWNKCMEFMLPSKIAVCVESDIIWEPSVIGKVAAKLDDQHHLVCPMLMTDSSVETFGFERFYDTWGFSLKGKKFSFYPPYWDPKSSFNEEKDLLQVTTAGGMLVATYEQQKKGMWGLDCCIRLFPEEVKIFMDKTLKIYHPAPADWKNLSCFKILLKKLRYRFLILANKY